MPNIADPQAHAKQGARDGAAAQTMTCLALLSANAMVETVLTLLGRTFKVTTMKTNRSCISEILVQILFRLLYFAGTRIGPKLVPNPVRKTPGISYYLLIFVIRA